MFGLLLTALAVPLLSFGAPVQLSKRTSGRATYYQVGLGACGQFNYPGDFIVALNEAQFDTGGFPSPQCGRGLTITYNGKSAHATVMDLCPAGGCSYGDLDLSEGLFTFFEPTSTGVFYMTWEFDGDGQASPAPPPPSSSPDPVYTPPATTTTTSSTDTPTSTSTIAATTSTAPSSSPSVSSDTTTQTPSDQDVGDTTEPEPTPGSGNVLSAVNVAAVHLANLVFAAGNAT